MTQPSSDGPMPEDARLLRISAEATNLARIRRFVQGRAIEFGADPEAAWDVVQAVDESVTNIIEHGYRGADGIVEVEIQAEGGVLVVLLRDHAPVFDPTGVPSPDLDTPLDRRPLGGMGVHLTRDLTDEVRHQSPPGWSNELTLVKKIR
jgi:serine/threonine-protein kinase RsbW